MTSSAPTAIVRDGLPDWLLPVRAAAETVRPEQLSRFLPPAEGGRRSAVLLLFGEGAGGPDLLLTERSKALRSHAGQISFPGGSLDAVDGDPHGSGPVAAALREAEEETGLDPGGVQVFATLPALYIPVSDFVVTPVLGWWREESPVAPVDPGRPARSSGSRSPSSPTRRTGVATGTRRGSAGRPSRSPVMWCGASRPG